MNNRWWMGESARWNKRVTALDPFFFFFFSHWFCLISIEAEEEEEEKENGWQIFSEVLLFVEQVLLRERERKNEKKKPVDEGSHWNIDDISFFRNRKSRWFSCRTVEEIETTGGGQRKTTSVKLKNNIYMDQNAIRLHRRKCVAHRHFSVRCYRSNLNFSST